ncbi:hypothetical protein [Leptospira semungkisensis]|uniref:hypothetical protein n=1 Tax=Leptospira semungkisensis TaxID=2484985 RepID=UPI00143832E9|nr:hypothetical protein [Leptospira semungkisensis]
MQENSNYDLQDFPWYSWGSPIGLGIAAISAATSLAILAYSFAYVLSAWKGIGG